VRWRPRPCPAARASHGGLHRVPQIRHDATPQPSTISTSPTLKTLLSGHRSGTAKTSPRNPSRARVSTPEFVKPGALLDIPAAASAAADAGRVPPLRVIATPLEVAPSPSNHSPGTRRLAATNKPAAT
jgi:hypothetical protein